MSLTRSLAMALAGPIGFAIVAVPGAIYLDHIGTSGIVGPNGVAPEPSVSYPQRLVQKYGCWTGDAPANVKFPGHVIVAKDGGVAYYSADVGPALDQAFGVKDTGLTVYGFCR